jgi:hypothetical protein
MRLLEITAIGIRLFGILLFLKLLNDVTGWLTVYGPGYASGDNVEINSLVILLYCIPIVLSLVFIKFPVSIAKLIVPVTSSSSPELESDGKTIQYAGLTLLGVYVLTYAIPNLVYYVISIFIIVNSRADLGESQYSYVINLISTLVELGIGVYLILGVNGLVKFISKLRNRILD